MLTYPSNDSEGPDLAAAYREAQQEGGLLRVRPPCGESAWRGPRVLEVTR